MGLMDLDVLMRETVKRFAVPSYSSAEYLRNAGLWGWEREAMEAYFPKSGRILVGAAGAGRELVCRPAPAAGLVLLAGLGLHDVDFAVEGIERQLRRVRTGDGERVLEGDGADI